MGSATVCSDSVATLLRHACVLEIQSTTLQSHRRSSTASLGVRVRRAVQRASRWGHLGVLHPLAAGDWLGTQFT
jgi:hypothetical protein